MKYDIYEIWLSNIELSDKDKYIERFGSARELFNLSNKVLINEKVPYNDYINLINKKNKESAKSIVKFCYDNNISIVDKCCDKYPYMLKYITNAPRILYLKGEIDNTRKCVAVVGSRNPSPYGLKCTSFFTRKLVENGYIVVSGLAKGIDSRAHSTSISNNGKTYAVLGSGVSCIYPKQNEELSNDILKNGALISEYPPLSKPIRWHFPQRNRLISGICHATIVVEGKKNSGSLITAMHSIEQGREVFCVPGNIFSENSRGVNDLINDGARSLCNPQDLLQFLRELQY